MNWGRPYLSPGTITIGLAVVAMGLFFIDSQESLAVAGEELPGGSATSLSPPPLSLQSPIILAQATPLPGAAAGFGTPDPGEISSGDEAPYIELKSKDILNWRDRARSKHEPDSDARRSPTIGSEEVRKACGRIKDEELLAQEQSLIEEQAALMDEMNRVEAIQIEVQARWSEVRAMEEAAQSMQLESENYCMEWGYGSLASAENGSAEVADPAELAENQKLEDRVQNLVAIIKSMKPKPAARILQGWDVELAAMILMKLPARVASKVVAAMPPGEAGKLTAKLAPEEQ